MDRRPSTFTTAAAQTTQTRTLRLVEHVMPEQEQSYLEWSREIGDVHANFVQAHDPDSWSSVVMIRDRAFGSRRAIRYIKIFRFPDDATIEAWLASAERREQIRRGQALGLDVDDSDLTRQFQRRSVEESFPIFDMFTEDGAGCGRERVASACLIGMQVYCLVTLYTYVLRFVPGFTDLHFQWQLLCTIPEVVATIETLTNRVVVRAARKVGLLATPPAKWGGAPTLMAPPPTLPKKKGGAPRAAPPV